MRRWIEGNLFWLKYLSTELMLIFNQGKVITKGIALSDGGDGFLNALIEPMNLQVKREQVIGISITPNKHSISRPIRRSSIRRIWNQP
jgi:glycerate kinase